MFNIKRASLQGAITCVTLSKMCCINMCLVINRYVSTSILTNVQVRNLKFFSTRNFQTYTNKNKVVADNNTKRKISVKS
jgi:hypothetical protein